MPAGSGRARATHALCRAPCMHGLARGAAPAPGAPPSVARGARRHAEAGGGRAGARGAARAARNRRAALHRLRGRAPVAGPARRGRVPGQRAQRLRQPGGRRRHLVPPERPAGVAPGSCGGAHALGRGLGPPERPAGDTRVSGGRGRALTRPRGRDLGPHTRGPWARWPPVWTRPCTRCSLRHLDTHSRARRSAPSAGSVRDSWLCSCLGAASGRHLPLAQLALAQAAIAYGTLRGSR